jgi:hypothetical protein
MAINHPPSRLHPFSPPPRAVSPRWESIGGPNFQYFLHVLWFSLIPLLCFAWLALVFSWAAFGNNVEGRFSWSLIPPNNGRPPQDQMQIEYRVGNVPHILPASVDHKGLQQLGMPPKLNVLPGHPLFTAVVPVRILHIGTWQYVEPVYPWTWLWRRSIPPLLLTILSTAALIILHGEMFQTLRRSYHLVKHGMPIDGTFLETHETGWWQSSGEYRWTYIRRCYVDYTFVGPDGHEYRGCQLVLGAIDPASVTEGRPVIVLYDPKNLHRHVMYSACAFRAKAGQSRSEFPASHSIDSIT